MNREIKIVLVKFFIITGLLIVFVFISLYYIPVLVNQFVFHNPNDSHVIFAQQFPQDQLNNQFQNPNQFGNNQFGQQGFNQGFDQNQQFGQNQFQQFPQQMNQYPSYGTPPYPQQYGPYQQQGQYGTTGTVLEQIITAIAAAGGSMAYTRRKTNQLEDTNQQLYSEVLKGKQVDAELARITYQMNKTEADKINDAPSVKLENLQQDVQQFTDKTAKA